MNMTWGDVPAASAGVRRGLAGRPPCRAFAGIAIAILAPLFVAGCAVGPDFSKPAAPDISSYTAHPAATTASSANVVGGGAQHFNRGGEIPADWWTLFHSTALNALIEQSLKS